MLILYRFNCPLFHSLRYLLCGRRRTCAIKHNILLQGTNHIMHIHVQKRINTFHFYIYYYLYICYICISIEKKICAFYLVWTEWVFHYCIVTHILYYCYITVIWAHMLLATWINLLNVNILILRKLKILGTIYDKNIFKTYTFLKYTVYRDEKGKMIQGMLDGWYKNKRKRWREKRREKE